MLLLVMGANYVIMFIGWEGVGPLFLSADWFLVEEQGIFCCGQQSFYHEQDW
jgi:hypothetical protein